MEKKINIAKLLKDAPKQYDLYSPIFGAVQLVGVDEMGIITVDVFDDDPPGKEHSWKEKFDRLGRYYTAYSINADAECMLLPKDGTWENFNAPWLHKQFEAGEKVLVKTDFFDVCKVEVWCLDLYSHYDERHDTHCLIGGSWCSDDRILPYKGNESLLGKEACND